MDVQEIFKKYEPELILVEKELNHIFESKVVFIPLVGKHLIEGGGKRLRPLSLLLSSDLSGYREKPRLILAGVIEAIHTASLLHDDVVDDAVMRRGKTTSHSIWGNQIVILVGDFIYANALRLAVGEKNLSIVEALSQAIMKMSEGEVFQLYKAADPSITSEDYLTIIAAKTGALFSAACRIGGILGNLDEERIEALANFGLKIGVVFQMSDDILDFDADEERLGKTIGKDLDEGKITLPMIYLLQSVDDAEREEITGIIQSKDNPKRYGDNHKDLRKILQLFKQYHVIEESYHKAKKVVEDAKAELSIFEDSPQKEALLSMANYALNRRR